MRITTKTEIPVKCDPGTDSVEGIAQAIRDLQVYGIGEKLSLKIARRFGRYAFDRMIDSEDFCYHIDGIGQQKAFMLREKVLERFGPELRKKERRDNESHLKVSDEPELQVRYPDRQDTVGYDSDALHNVELAYATTIHKSQGSEYDIVVIVLTSSAYIMLQRNLLYTAVTRAKEKCIIVGDRKAIETTVANWRLRPRYTRLKERLKE